MKEIPKYYVGDQLTKVGPIEDEYVVKHTDHAAREKVLLDALRDLANSQDCSRDGTLIKARALLAGRKETEDAE